MIFKGKKLTGLMVVIALMGLIGCSSTKKSSEPKTDYAMELNGDSDSGLAGRLRSVYFDFDSSVLLGDTRDTLDENIKYLAEHHEVEIQIEGHCDERGSSQYNLALGERRARAVYDYLVANDIASMRIYIISMGKEKPIAFGHNEEAWSQNRRANFVITKLR
ncbi:MAG: peptidoglycan-associated lipoprotein Pal [Deltaproteobacteria bacterium]|nr:MAG: peptidoglycan-associated lipoprotein Pal [Deltaproteobacteria bacterium]